MTKISKHFKLDTSVLECIAQIQTEVKKIDRKDEKLPTQTKVVEMAVYHYYVSLFGEKALTDVILQRNK